MEPETQRESCRSKTQHPSPQCWGEGGGKDVWKKTKPKVGELGNTFVGKYSEKHRREKASSNCAETEVHNGNAAV